MTDSEGLERRRLFWILQCGGWAAFGAGMFVAGISQWSAAFTAVHKSSLTVFGFVLTLALRGIYRGLARRGVPSPALLALAAPLSFAAAGVWMAAHNLVLKIYLAGRRGSPASLAGFPDFANTIYFSWILVAWSVLYFAIPAYRDLRSERERARRAELLAQQARLAALRLQLNPHFLFNALNAVSTLVADGRGEEANRMLGRLADFLRVNLDRGDASEVRLEEEIDFARQYLEIERVRFGDRLRIGFSVPPEAGKTHVPPMILQPLVENAVRHAVLPRAGGGEVAIAARRQGEWLDLEVDDDGPGLGGSGETLRGIGLANTRARLSELYGPRAELRFGRSGLGGLAVTVRIPFRAAVSGAA